MQTRCPVTNRLEHPLDMLKEFSGRIAVFDHAAHYSLLLHEARSLGPEIPADISRGLQALASDFRAMQKAAGEWFETHRKEGEE